MAELGVSRSMSELRHDTPSRVSRAVPAGAEPHVDRQDQPQLGNGSAVIVRRALAFQRTIGNQAVVKLLAASASDVAAAAHAVHQIQRTPERGEDGWRDSALGNAYRLVLRSDKGGRYRFQIEGTRVEFEYDANSLKYFSGKGAQTTAAEIRRELGRGELATGIAALAQFQASGEHPGAPSEQGLELISKYLGMASSGVANSNEVMEALQAGKPWRLTDLGRQLGLNEFEELALYAYSQPNKEKFLLGASSNPIHMFATPAGSHWGHYVDGWTALQSALGKIPDLGQLGLSTVPTFRVERSDSKLMPFLRAGIPAYIFHGIHHQAETKYLYWPDRTAPTVQTPMNQAHFSSASVMPSSHSWKKEVYRGGVIKFECPSAKFINAWGGMGLLDGGEVLIPPGIVSFYNGAPIQQAWMGESVTMYVLKEVPGPTDPSILQIDDFTAEPLPKPTPRPREDTATVISPPGRSETGLRHRRPQPQSGEE